MFLEQYVLYELQQKMNVLLDQDKMWREREEELSRRLEELKAGKRALQSKQKALQAERLESYERYAAGKRAEEDGKAAGKRAEEGGKAARRRAEEGENAAGRSPGRDGSLAAEYQDSINRICAQEKETEALLADTERIWTM